MLEQIAVAYDVLYIVALVIIIILLSISIRKTRY